MRIVIIDDDERVTESVGLLLEQLGHDVWSASQSAEALELVDRHDIEVALVDQALGAGDSGLALLSRLAAQRPHVGRVLMTGGDTDDLSEECVEAVLTKPFGRVELQKLMPTFARA